MEWIPVAISSLSVADVQPIVIKRKRLVLVRENAVFYVFASKCPHAGADLGTAWCKKGYLICPVHRHQYSLENGRGAKGQGDYLKNYPTKIVGDHILVGFKKSWFKFW